MTNPGTERNTLANPHVSPWEKLSSGKGGFDYILKGNKNNLENMCLTQDVHYRRILYYTSEKLFLV
jgi:hypothetical protein